MTIAFPEFTFMGFEPDDDLRMQATCSLDEMLEMAPYGAIAVALLEKNESGYRCSIEIYSQHGPFSASGSDHTGKAALETVVRLLAPKLKRWNERLSCSRTLQRRILRPMVR